jgi:hypothetical protein
LWNIDLELLGVDAFVVRVALLACPVRYSFRIGTFLVAPLGEEEEGVAAAAAAGK